MFRYIARFGRGLPLIAQYAFFLRYPLLIAIAIVLLPFAESRWWPTMFDLSHEQIFSVVFFMTLAAWACLLAALVILDTAPRRFSVPRVRWAAHLSRWWMLSAPLMVVPLIVRLIITNPNDAAIMMAAAEALLAAFAVVSMLTLLRQILVPPGINSPLMIFAWWTPRNLSIGLLRRLVERWLPPKRLRKIPRILGAGYVDYARGRLRPGPLWMFILLLFTLAACALSDWHLTQAIEHQMHASLLPTLAYVEIMIILLIFFLASLSLFLDRYRIPVLLVVAAWIIVSSIVDRTGHYFPITHLACSDSGAAAQNPQCRAPNDVSAVVDPLLARYHTSGADKPVLVIVCASGGGAPATAWTARVLTGLEEDLGVDFIHSIRLISAVSGGALGTLYYVSSYSHELGAPPPEQLPFINRAAHLPSDALIVQSVAQRGLLAMMLPFADDGSDRASAIERGWSRAMLKEGRPYHISQRLSDWSEGVREGWLPATIFQSTIVETGQPLLFSTTAIPSYLQAAFFGTDSSVYDGADIRVVTSVRLSASFSYASPVAAARYTDPLLQAAHPPVELHLGDGGYYDNFGVEAAVHWAWDVLQQYRGRLRKIIIVQIRARPPVALEAPASLGWVVQSAGPVRAAVKSLRRAHDVRDEVELRNLIEESGGLVERVVFTAESGAGPSWSLPADSPIRIERDWQTTRHSDEMRKLKQLFQSRN